MKTLLLALSFLLFAFATKAEVILDADGDPLLPGAQYYIYPVFFGPFIGGGLRPGKASSNSIYKTSVLKSFSTEDYGEPLKFLPLQKIGIIKTDIKLSIEFVHTPEGVSSGKWIPVKDIGDEIWSVGIGGPQDHEGYETLTGFFKIKEAREGYKFSFLPNNHLNETFHEEIEESFYLNRWRLIFTTALPYYIKFIKVPSERSWI
ncbi:hypothetical protein L6164_016626 [Bauhinia variegata]|uniref:Uncharacterized protein n=1 Tax=Bauhinia variegata TaxID=167791 RepID=A0ACB9NRS6_BAUVA|nr:hypothetical protein L6164_016626 [Bauhinia variegata]